MDLAAVRGGLKSLSLPKLIALAGIGFASFLFIMSLTSEANSIELKTWALVVFAISLFATHILPEHVTALLIFLLAIIGGVAPASVVFSGFEVGALWLLFSGIIIGSAAQEAGLGVYIARRILGAWQMTYLRAIVLLVAIAGLLGLIVPATIPRIILLMPIALGMAEAMGLKEGGKGYTGLALAAGVGTFLPTFSILTANLPAVVHVGAIETVYGIKISYGEYLYYQLPITGLFRALVLIGLLMVFFREPAREIAGSEEQQMTPKQAKLLAVLLGAILFWVTDIVHGIHPAWVAMTAAIIILWPTTKLISPTAFKDRIDFSPVLYIAGLLSIGAIMARNGLDKELGDFILQHVAFSAESTFLNLYLVTLLSLIVCLITTAPAAPILLVPIAGEIGQVSGLPLLAVLMSELVGFSTMIMPYQGPPMIVLLSLSVIKIFDLTKICMLLAGAMLIFGIPLAFFWWRAIGLL